MHDLKKVYEECVKELKAINIPIQDDKIFSVETEKRWTATFGMLETYTDDTFRMRIFDKLLSDDVDITDLKGVVAHELVHTCPGCNGHDKLWLSYVKKIDETYGYPAASQNSQDWMFNKGTIKHRAVCQKCGSYINFKTDDGPRHILSKCKYCPGELKLEF